MPTTDLPFPFTAKYVVPRGNKVRDAIFVAWAPFDVPGATPGQAPVAYRHLGVEFRAFEGRYYRSIGQGSDVPPEALSKFGPSWNDALLPRLPAMAGTYKAVSDMSSEAEIRPGTTLVETGRDTGRQEAAAAYRESLLVVDGATFVAVDEPGYAVTADGTLMTVDWAPRPGANALHFACDRLDDAKAFAAGLYGEAVRDLTQGDEIEVAEGHACGSQADLLAHAILAGGQFKEHEAWSPGMARANAAMRVEDERRRDGWGERFMEGAAEFAAEVSKAGSDAGPGRRLALPRGTWDMTAFEFATLGRRLASLEPVLSFWRDVEAPRLAERDADAATLAM